MIPVADFEFDRDASPVLAPRDDVIRLLQLLLRTLARADVACARADWEAVNRTACAVVRLLSDIEDEHGWDLGTKWNRGCEEGGSS